jgi:hypothetical protein
MLGTSKNAAAWLWDRWVLLSLMVLGIGIVSTAVLRLPQYPEHQAASLRQRIETASPTDLVPKDRLALEKDLLQYETDNRVKIWTAIVQAIGGAALLVGLLFTWRTLRATQLKLDIDRAGQLTNRFTASTTQLGAQLNDGTPNVEARVGGIYALAWIGRDSPEEYWTVMEILTAYVRHNAPWPPPDRRISSPEGTPDAPKPRSDIQAILTVLGRSKPPHAKSLRLDQKFDLRRTDLRGAEFWDAHLERTDFWGAHLEGAEFWGASLEDAKLVHTHLEGANLRGATLVRADLTDAHLRGANLDGADLQGSILQGTDLQGAQGLTQAQLSRALRKGAGALLPADLAPVAYPASAAADA